MSHFTVLVIGENIEEQLQPYHEFECTGIEDQYVVDVDITDKVLEQSKEDGYDLNSALEYYGLEDRTVRDVSEIERGEKHKYGYAILSEQSTLLKAVTRTNPNKKWDWWQEGGRWRGYLKLKDGVKSAKISEPHWTETFNGGEPKDRNGSADSALKGDVDFESKRDEAEKSARDRWTRVHEIINGKLNGFESWESLRERFSSVDEARKAYHEQPAVKALHGTEFSWDGIEPYNMPLDEYAANERAKAGITYAVVKDGKWYQRGEMGWFGISSNEKDPETWESIFWELVNSTPDDVRLTVVDCHI